MTEEEKEKIRKKVKNGFPEGEIKKQLRDEGLNEEEIREIFMVPKANMGSWYLVWAIVILVLAIYILSKTGIISLLVFGFSGLLFYEYYRTRARRD